ncbi:MAG: DEAD/DEAH box helicase, partial [Halobacteriales archaeon]
MGASEVPQHLPSEDRRVLELLEPRVREWWLDQFGAGDGALFTPPQREAIPAIHEGRNTLVAAPTGIGKTLASFSAIINDLYRREQTEGLENSVYCLYVSPLRSLANDIHRNLDVPLSAITENQDVEIQHAIRHGDTDDYDRQRMLEETPHILNTTPETLAILLCAPKFREKLRTVEYVIVDEIHSLAADKRGTHL